MKNWRIALPLLMLVLAALACSPGSITTPGIIAIEADPNQAGVVYILTITKTIIPDGATLPNENEAEYQYFEVSDYGNTWRPINQPIIGEISDEHAIFMDDLHTLYIDDEPVWTYPLHAGKPASPWFAVPIHLGARPSPTDYYVGNYLENSGTLRLDYAISPADSNTIFIGLFNLGVLVGPAPNSDSDRKWELHVLKANGREIDSAHSGDVPMPISNDTVNRIFWGSMILHGFLPAICMYLWIYIRRRYEFVWIGNWLIWLISLILTILIAVFWISLAYPEGVGINQLVLIPIIFTCILVIAISTGTFTYSIAKEKEQQTQTLQKNTENPA